MRRDTAATSVIVYDGACAFCRQAIDAIRHRDREKQFLYFARQTPGLDEKHPELAIGNFNTGMRLIEPDGTMYIGADAVYVISSRLPYFRWFAWTYQLPLINSVARRIYSWIAANRLKLSGYCNDSCEIATDAQVVSKSNAADHMSLYQILISIIILLVIALHAWADAAKVIVRSSWMGDRSWPFLAYGMYRQSYRPGVIRATKERIIGVTAGNIELEVTPVIAGLGGQALARHYIGPIRNGDPSAPWRLAQRINLDRQDPIVAFRVEKETYAITDTGVVTEGKQAMTYPVTK
jgi:predicted DCC family thiol-disulfide oxidoreductase YuxK